ncbi:MAG: hypothetical protein GKR88_17215 [Flavobacteriaceae bacterium]|nr:MAG: hypothetical protein GKR88_17215 [Flavobacteriaceae bacterium]
MSLQFLKSVRKTLEISQREELTINDVVPMLNALSLVGFKKLTIYLPAITLSINPHLFKTEVNRFNNWRFFRGGKKPGEKSTSIKRISHKSCV